MKTVFNKFLALLVSLVLLIQGCATPPFADKTLIGYLSVIGTEVQLNGEVITRDSRVRIGNRITIGENSSAYLYFLSGGFVHFDANTDPIFDIILDNIIEVTGFSRGQIFAETPPDKQLVVRTPDGDVETQGTQFNLKVGSDESMLTVHEGQVKWLGEAPRIIRAGEQLGLREGQILYVRSLSPEQLQETIRWRDRYPVPDSRPRIGDVLGPLGAAIIIGTWFLLSGDDDEPDQPNPEDSTSGGDDGSIIQ